jgi:hypothetical protein
LELQENTERLNLTTYEISSARMAGIRQEQARAKAPWRVAFRSPEPLTSE